MAITIKRQLGQSQDGGDRLLKRRQERKSTADCDTVTPVAGTLQVNKLTTQTGISSN